MNRGIVVVESTPGRKMENAQIAKSFEEIADLLELQQANNYRIRSYRSAAQTVRNLSERLEDLAAQDADLSKLPNIGEATAKKIHEILERGTCERLEELRAKVPKGLPDLLQIPGVGSRKAVQLHKELKIKSLDDLKSACEQHKVRELEGMGQKTEEKILNGIGLVEGTKGRKLYQEAGEHLDSLARHLDGVKEIDRWEVAGSYRRGKETIGDLDVLLLTGNREEATKGILDYSAIADVVSKGQERVTVRLKGGLQVDFRFFERSAFGAAWMYFTGSKAHNIKLRRIAQDEGWKLNEYGLFKGDQRLAGKSEKAVYRRLGLQWVEPEMREDRGEVEAAARQRQLPKLIETGDVHGDFQCHTTASDGKNSIKDMAQAAQDYGFDYLAITDHSKRVTMANGLDDDEALKHADAIRKVGGDMRRFWLLAGMEVDILKNGKLDLKETTLASLDWVVASIHYDRNLSRKDMTERILAAVKSGVVHSLGHPLGRIIGHRDPIAVDIDAIVEACMENDVWLEINGQPDRLDLPDNYCQSAREAGAKFVLSTDSHDTSGFRYIRFAVTVARRGWVRKQDVLNTKTISDLKQVLKKRS